MTGFFIARFRTATLFNPKITETGNSGTGGVPSIATEPAEIPEHNYHPAETFPCPSVDSTAMISVIIS